MVNAQEWLEKNYPIKKRAEIKKLEIKSKDLEGELDLREFNNLEHLDCTDNKLTDIKFSNNKKIKYLLIKSNNFEKNLSFLKEFINLVELDISNNPFFGNLISLENMEKLENLNISDTDIRGGIEFLPDRVSTFRCEVSEDSGADVQIIFNRLRKFGCVINEKEGLYDLKSAKRAMKVSLELNDLKRESELQILQQDQNPFKK